MRIESLDCNNCGAPVEVPENVTFMRCGHCGSRLKVHRESSAHYTEVLGKIEESTRELKNEVRALRLQNEIRDLDDAWRAKRETLMVRGKDGSVSQPSALMGLVTGGIGVVGGVIWIAVTSSAASVVSSSPFGRSSSGPSFPSPGFPGPMPMDSGPGMGLFSVMPLFGVLFILAGLAMGAYLVSRARAFDRAEAEYYEARRRLQERMGRERASRG